ncbi:MAG: hypothetical protein ABSG53_04170 [Thermoguttaceae bacterium]
MNGRSYGYHLAKHGRLIDRHDPRLADDRPERGRVAAPFGRPSVKFVQTARRFVQAFYLKVVEWQTGWTQKATIRVPRVFLYPHRA